MQYGDNNPELNNDQGYTGGYYGQPLRPIMPNQALVNAALVTGILTVVTTVMMTVYLPFIFGGISIVLAILSRMEDGVLPKNSKVGICVAICGMVLNIALVVGSVYTVFHNPEIKQQFNTICEQMYGQTFDEMIDTIKEGGELDLEDF